MRRLSFLLLGLLLMAPMDLPAVAQSGSFYTVTYVEVLPTATGQTTSLLKTYRDAGRKEQGALRLEVTQRLDRPNQFTVLGVWSDQAAYDAHAAGPAATALKEKLTPLLAAPLDTRQHNALAVGDVKSMRGATVTAVTHVDVIPPQKDNGVAAVKQLAEDSRKQNGNLRFDVWQQTNRPNHFTVVETWSNRATYEAHFAHQATRDFRGKLAAMTGALYDERLYRTVD